MASTSKNKLLQDQQKSLAIAAIIISISLLLATILVVVNVVRSQPIEPVEENTEPAVTEMTETPYNEKNVPRDISCQLFDNGQNNPQRRCSPSLLRLCT